MTDTPRIAGQLKVSKYTSRRLPSSHPKELIAEKILEHDGNLSKVCEDLKVMYIPLLDFVDKNYELRDLVVGCRISMTDQAEDVLRHHLEAHNLKAALWTLDRLGGSKGYTPKMETPVTPDNEEKKAVDLSKLSVAQLRSLRNLMAQASGDSQIIDITPTTVSDDTEN